MTGTDRASFLRPPRQCSFCLLFCQGQLYKAQVDAHEALKVEFSGMNEKALLNSDRAGRQVTQTQRKQGNMAKCFRVSSAVAVRAAVPCIPSLTLMGNQSMQRNCKQTKW